MHFSKNAFLKILQIFGGLVLGCIKTKFCKKICVWQHFSSSTRFTSFCTAAISKFSQKIGLKNQQFSWKISKKFANVAKFANFRRPRSRLYQNESLQENLRLAAFFKFYKMCIRLHRCNLKILAKNRSEKSAISWKIQQIFANDMLQNLQKMQNKISKISAR